jgi:RNA polymerase sigma factor (sigma-70 family)
MRTDQPIDQVAAEYGPMITRIAAAYEFDPDKSADLCQEILIALWKALPAFRGDASLKTFIARIAHNRCVNHVIRSHKSSQLTELRDDLPNSTGGPEELAIAADRRSQLLAAIRALPIAYRGPVSLVLEEFSPDEIAQMTGISTNAVHIRLTRAKALLRQRLKGTA